MEPNSSKRRGILGRRPWLRFSLRTLLITLTILGVWLGVTVERARKQERAASRVRELGGWVLYEFQIDSSTGRYFRGPKRYQVSPFGPSWLRKLLGPDLFNKPVSINLGLTDVTDDDLVFLQDMPQLRMVGVDKTRVSDAGLRHVVGLKHLEVLYLTHTLVTEDGVEWLREQRPELEILYSPGSVFSPGSREQFAARSDNREATRLGIRVNRKCEVLLVHPGSPADLAGIKVGDTVDAFGNTPVEGPHMLVDLADRQRLGSSLTMDLRRSGEAMKVNVVLDGAAR